MPVHDRLLTGLRAATMAPGATPYGLVEDAAIAVVGGRIAWVGPRDALPRDHAGLPATALDGRLVTPGLIDCHTHLVHGGDRAAEFEQRLGGATYEEVARAGGGILSTVRATRGADEAALVAAALPRLDALMAEGASTVEVKSGYGLDMETEVRMLRAARALGRHRPVRIRTTFLGAHAVPPEYAGRADAYVDEACIPALRAAHAEGLVDAVDGFLRGHRLLARPDRAGVRRRPRPRPAGEAACRAAFQPRRGGARGLPRGSVGGPPRIPRRGGRAGRWPRRARRRPCCPARFHTLRETQGPPVALLRAQGVPIALATDCNPGSSPLTSLLLAMNMACTLFRLTPEEALAGVTRNAAPRAGPCRLRHHRGGPARRPRRLGRGAAGRACLPHGVQPAARAPLRGKDDMSTLTLVPGAVTLAELARVWREEAAVRLDPACRPAMAASRARIEEAAAGGGRGLRRQHGLWQARLGAHRGRGHGAAAAQPDPVALLRRGRAHPARHGAAGHGAQAREPRARRPRACATRSWTCWRGCLRAA